MNSSVIKYWTRRLIIGFFCTSSVCWSQTATLQNTYSAEWKIDDSSTMNVTTLYLDLTPKNYFYEANGAVIYHQDGGELTNRLTWGTCVATDGILCRLHFTQSKYIILSLDLEGNGEMTISCCPVFEMSANFIGLRP